MSRAKGKRGAKKGVNAKKQPTGVVKVKGRLDNLLDYIKQALYHQGLTFIQLEEQMSRKLPGIEAEKLQRDLKRCLGNNISFYYRNNTWQMDKSGNAGNDPFYQYLMTTGYPMAFKELQALAAENDITTTELREQDFAYDGRFVRLKDGRWGLAYWLVIWEVSRQELNQMAQKIQNVQKPQTLAALARETLGLHVQETNLPQILSKDPRFLEVAPGEWYLQALLDALLASLKVPDEFAFIRQAELNALQEAELLLIIEEADITKREFILSSWDLERGILRLNKRLVDFLKFLNDVSYLSFPTAQGESGAWFLREEKCLAGLGQWCAAWGLEPGHKVEVSFSKDTGQLALRPSGERVKEVFTEGLKVKKLVSLKNQHAVLPLTLADLVTEILQLYPGGLDFNTLNLLVGLIAGADEAALQRCLRENFYFEENRNGHWLCNLAARQACRHWEDEKEGMISSIAAIRQQVAATTEEYNTLHDLKTNLEDELVYLQEHHRQEEMIFQAKIEELAAKNEHLTLENHRLRNEYELLEKNKRELLEHLEYQGGQLVAMRTDKNKLKVNLERSESKTMQLQSSLNQLMEDAHREVERLKNELTEKTHRLNSLQYANTELQRNLARLHEERRQMKRQVSSWPVKIVMFLSGLVGGRKTIGS